MYMKKNRMMEKGTFSKSENVLEIKNMKKKRLDCKVET